VGEFAKPEGGGGLVAAFLAANGNAGDLAAGVELDADRLRLAADPVLQADREGVALVDDRPAAVEQQMRAVQRARHQRFQSDAISTIA
jgi:hypothetical protein